MCQSNYLREKERESKRRRTNLEIRVPSSHVPPADDAQAVGFLLRPGGIRLKRPRRESDGRCVVCLEAESFENVHHLKGIEGAAKVQFSPALPRQVVEKE